VALGAAIQAGVLSGEVKDVLLLDVTPLSLGIETLGGVFTRLIERNTTIPVSKKEIFSTAEDNQSTVTIHVLQGEREMAGDNRTLARFNLDGITPAPRGLPQVEVAFDIDANGIVHVSAKDLATKKEQKVRIESSSGLTEADIQKMVKDAESHSEEDKKKRKLIDVRNQADSLIYATEKSLKENAESISTDDNTAIEAAIATLRESMNSDDPGLIEGSIQNLNKAAHKLAEAMYAKASAQSGAAGEPGGNGASAAKDATMDADFEVVDDEKK
jgi:molecular chaperone DnaK